MEESKQPGILYIELHSADSGQKVGSISFDPGSPGVNDFIVTGADGNPVARVHDTNRGYWVHADGRSAPAPARTWAEVADAAGFPGAWPSLAGALAPEDSAAGLARWEADRLARLDAESYASPGPAERPADIWPGHSSQPRGIVDREAGC